MGLAHRGQRLQEKFTLWMLLCPREGDDLKPFLHAGGVAGSYLSPPW